MSVKVHTESKRYGLYNNAGEIKLNTKYILKILK